MVGAIVLSHGDLADSLIKSTGMLVGAAPQIAAVSIYEDNTPEQFEEYVRMSLDNVDTGDGVVALVDLYGGTPNNVIFKLAHERKNIRIVTGVNLPMLVHLLTERQPETGLGELVDGLVASGREGIVEFGHKMV